MSILEARDDADAFALSSADDDFFLARRLQEIADAIVLSPPPAYRGDEAGPPSEAGGAFDDVGSKLRALEEAVHRGSANAGAPVARRLSDQFGERSPPPAAADGPTLASPRTDSPGTADGALTLAERSSPDDALFAADGATPAEKERDEALPGRAAIDHCHWSLFLDAR